MSDIAIQQVAPVAQGTLFWLLIGASKFDAEVKKGQKRAAVFRANIFVLHAARPRISPTETDQTSHGDNLNSTSPALSASSTTYQDCHIYLYYLHFSLNTLPSALKWLQRLAVLPPSRLTPSTARFAVCLPNTASSDHQFQSARHGLKSRTRMSTRGCGVKVSRYPILSHNIMGYQGKEC